MPGAPGPPVPPGDGYGGAGYGDDDRLQPLYDERGYGPYDDYDQTGQHGYDPQTGPVPSYGQPPGRPGGDGPDTGWGNRGPDSGYGAPSPNYDDGAGAGAGFDPRAREGYGQRRADGLRRDDGYAQPTDHGRNGGLGHDDGYGQPPGFGQDRGHDRSTGFGQDRGHDRSTGFGQDRGHDQTASYGEPTGYGQDRGYDRSSGFGRDRGHDQTASYGQDRGHDQTASYGQDRGHDQTSSFGQDRGYDQTSGYGQPPGYGQDGGYAPGRAGLYAPDTDEGQYGSGAPSAPDGLYMPPPGAGARPGPGMAANGPGAPDLSYDDAGNGNEPNPPRRRRLGPPGGERPRRQRQPEPDDDGPQLPFVPGFAGLRAVALLAVLGWGAGLDALKGGYLGISSVFTLSGFLVATLALAEWSQHGQLFLARFWERRARRIVPPYFVVLAGVVVLQVVVRVGSVPTFRGDLLAALGFAENWRLAYPAEGFARSFAELSAVRHLWPVAITVQILVLLPLVFMLFMIVTGRKWRAAGGLFGLVAAASFGVAWMMSGRPGGRDLAYYGTHTRAGEMLVGVVLAYLVLTPAFRKVLTHRRVMPVVRWGALGALGALVLLWLLVPIDSPRLFHGVTIANAVLTAWVVLAVTLPGPANSVLGTTPLRYLGQISYATYLVFWPVYLLLDEDRLGQDGIVLAGIRITAAVGAGALLHWLVEVPLRHIKLNRQSLGIGLVGCGAAVAVVALVLPVNPPANISLTIDDGNGPGDIDAVMPEGGGGEATNVLLIGDQTAGSLVSGFEAWNGENTDDQMRVHTHITSDCPLGGPGEVQRLGSEVEPSLDCEAWRPRLPRMLDQADYDVIVVLMGTADLGQRKIDNQWHHLGDPAYDRFLASQIDGLADVLGEQDVPVLWVTQPHVRLTTDDESADWTQFEDNDPYRVDRLNELVASVIREREGFDTADLGAWLYDQPRGEFNPDLRDGAGFTEEGATEVVTWLGPQAQRATSS